MYFRFLLMSLGLHAFLIFGIGIAVGTESARPAIRHLRIAVPEPTPPMTPLADERAPLAVVFKPVELAEPDLDSTEDFSDLEPKPKPAPKPLEPRPPITKKALARLQPPAEKEPPAAIPPPPAELVRCQRIDDENEHPPYPKDARRLGQEGEIQLRLRVSATGEVDHVEVAQPCRWPILNRAALNAARKWRFQPAHRGDQAMDDVILQTVRFQLKD